ALIVTVIQAPAGWSSIAREHIQSIRQLLRRRTATIRAVENPVGAGHLVAADESLHSVGFIGARTLPEPRTERRLLMRTDDLSVHYGGVIAVGGATVEVREGEIVGLIGPNGAGKTSFMDALTGFTPASGAVDLCGERIDRLPPHRRARLGLARTWQSVEL